MTRSMPRKSRRPHRNNFLFVRYTIPTAHTKLAEVSEVSPLSWKDGSSSIEEADAIRIVMKTLRVTTDLETVWEGPCRDDVEAGKSILKEGTTGRHQRRQSCKSEKDDQNEYQRPCLVKSARSRNQAHCCLGRSWNITTSRTNL